MNNYYNKNNNTLKSTLESLVYNKYFYLVFNILFLILGKITNDYPRVFFTAYFLMILSTLNSRAIFAFLAIFSLHKRHTQKL